MNTLYILIKGSNLMGIFSSKEVMKVVIEEYVKDKYQKNGCYGDYHFRYIEFTPDQPWIEDGKEFDKELGKAIFSLSTMHDEYFPNKVEINWSIGKIIKL